MAWTLLISAIALLATNSQFRIIGYIVFGVLLGLTRILYTARATSFPELFVSTNLSLQIQPR